MTDPEQTTALRQEDDVLGVRPVLICTAICLAFIAAAPLFAHLELPRSPLAPIGNPAAKSAVKLSLIDIDQSAARERRAQTHRLETYGWIDAQREIAHIPIARAMQIFLERESEARAGSAKARPAPAASSAAAAPTTSSQNAEEP